MRFCLIHLHDEPTAEDGEEVAVVLPDCERVAMTVPLDALPDFLPLLEDATAEQPPQCCANCGERLPGDPS